MTKTRRNEPCVCGSGLRYKHCHGSYGSDQPPTDIAKRMDVIWRTIKAKEQVREIQQGFGNPILTDTLEGYRFVGVANKLLYSKRWKYFTDFLLDYLKDTLGREWGQEQKQAGLDHPVFRWLSRMQKARTSDNEKTGVPEIGFLTSIFRLAYALYLIEHNDRLSKSLMSRLRLPDQFDAAYYETIVAAAFALSGAKIENAENKQTSARTPEFWAVGRSGRRYAVEAKRRMSWKNKCDPESASFKKELRRWLRNKLHAASKKKLENAVYWFELAIGESISEEDWRKIQSLVRKFVSEAEEITIDGESALPAYLVVTNNSHVASDDVPGSPFCAILEGFNMPDFYSGQRVEIELAMETRDRHRDIEWVFQCLSEVQRIPTSFDGTPVELLDDQGEPIPTVKLGQTIAVDGPDGDVISGPVNDLCSVGEQVAVTIQDDKTGRRILAQIPMTAEEKEAVGRYGDAVFGKPGYRVRDVGNDPLKLYDWFLEIYANYPKEALLRQVSSHPQLSEMSKLNGNELLRRVAREVTKTAVSRK